MPYDPKMSNAQRGTHKDQPDYEFWPTLDARWIVPALTRFVPLPRIVWEPHAGRGHLARALVDAGAGIVKATELHSYDPLPQCPRIDYGLDFFDFQEPPEGCAAIVMNPPYKDRLAHVEHAVRLMSLCDGIVCSLMRAESAHAVTHAHMYQGSPHFAAKIELTKRPQWVEGKGQFHPRHNFAWFVWNLRKPFSETPRIYWGP